MDIGSTWTTCTEMSYTRFPWKIVLSSKSSWSPANLSPYLKELLKPYKPSRSLRSSTHSLLDVLRTVSTSTYGERVFSVSAPKLWSGLLQQLRNAESLATFKKLLKTHRFNNPTAIKVLCFCCWNMVPSWVDVFRSPLSFSLPSVRVVCFLGSHGFCCSFLLSSADWASCIYVQSFRLLM